MDLGSTVHQHLARRPKSSYRQLYVGGTRIRADVIYRQYASQEPLKPEQIAANFQLPVEAVLEAIRYCESQPQELEEDRRREARLAQASGVNDPDYETHGTPKPLSAQELARLQER